MQYTFLLLYGITLFIFSQIYSVETPSPDGDLYFVLSIQFIFIIVTIALLLFTFYLKSRFTSYRKYIELTNARLMNSTQNIAAQTAQQQTLNIELSAIQNNLEELVEAKVKEVRQMSAVLREYAFVNAHHVRAPLARILGLINLLDKHGMSADTANVVNAIQSEAQEMDKIIKKIDQITS
jgi:signal transduction histidine kinase